MNDNLYREELMEIYKHPHNRGSMTNPSVSVVKDNPMCGDQISFQLLIKDGVIKDAKYNGSACAVSIISSETLLVALKDKTVGQAGKLSKDDILDLVNLNLTTSRVKCATLCLDALHEALQTYEKTKQ